MLISARGWEMRETEFSVQNKDKRISQEADCKKLIDKANRISKLTKHIVIMDCNSGF